MFSIKTPRVHTPGVFFRLLKFPLITLGLSAFCGPAAADCPASKIHELAQIAHVYDGDTLRLKDGRKLRIIGINAPEKSASGRAAEALADAATRAASVFFNAEQVRLEFDKERRDRYGRVLAHAYNNEGRSLAAHLLEQGLAFHIGVPPNLTAADCLARHQQRARQQKKGVWRDPFWAPRVASDLDMSDTGFRRITGKVTGISGGKKRGEHIWIELDGPVVVKITAADRKNFNAPLWRGWQGKNLEVVGWVTDRSSSAAVAKRGFKPLVLQVRTPYAITVLSSASK